MSKKLMRQQKLKHIQKLQEETMDQYKKKDMHRNSVEG